MANRRHSRAVKLAATVLARLAGEQAASDTFGIDRRTIRGWVKHEDVPTDSWAALDDLAGAQLLERVARGEVTNATTLATVRGIASRNRRYAELIARREARRDEAPADDTPPQERRRRVLDAVAPAHWRMPAHHSSDPADREAPDYVAARAFDDYVRACRRHAVGQLDGQGDEPDEYEPSYPDPMVPDAIGPAGMYYLFRMAADTSDERPNTAAEYVNAWDLPGIGAVATEAMTDDEYGAFITDKLLPMVQVEADAWWPLYTAELEAIERRRRPVVVAPVEASEPAVSRSGRCTRLHRPLSRLRWCSTRASRGSGGHGTERQEPIDGQRAIRAADLVLGRPARPHNRTTAPAGTRGRSHRGHAAAWWHGSPIQRASKNQAYSRDQVQPARSD